jgi:dihydrofolate synthase/folylpolyglutamate synthase
VGIALTDYRGALDYLFARTTGESRLGLERTTALLAALGDPHHRFRSFHIAGTNGKGSVAATLDALLRRPGRTVGRYTSPHLVDFRERVLIDGLPIAPEKIVAFIERWTPAIERIGATFFEATTAMAFHLFAEARTDIVVVETGLGGRLDATNVVMPVVAGVTMIGIDHTEYLGTTITTIAREKAGIFKPGAVAVIGDPAAPVARLLAEHALAAGSRGVVRVADTMQPRELDIGPEGTSFECRRAGSKAVVALTTPLIGRHQVFNAATAIAMADAGEEGSRLGDDELRTALACVSLPGRFQRHERIIFDVAHNPDGAAVLAATMRRIAPPRPVSALVTVLSDKDWRGMLKALAPVVDHFVLSVAPTAPLSRLWNPVDALREAKSAGWSAEVVMDFDAAIARALEAGSTVLITGSFHTVGDAMVRLQAAPFAR